jgi:hypothetical protein
MGVLWGLIIAAAARRRARADRAASPANAPAAQGAQPHPA